MNCRLLLLLMPVVGLAAAAPTARLCAAEIKVALQTHRTWDFPEDGVRFDNQFPGARVNELQRIGPHEYRITISPENQPINVSPWYAFRVTASRRATVTVRLAYSHGNHRYHPKTSRDAKTWEPLPESAYRFDRPVKEAVLTLETAAGGTLWVAAQEMIGTAEVHAWMDVQAKLPFVRGRIFGQSLGQRPLRLFEVSEGAPPKYVFIIGRQHPPEVTGTLGLMAFVETINGNSAAARDFRRSFRTVVMPLLNPDGVDEGHWRSNFGALDLNRDWKKSSQPEITAARETMLDSLREPGARMTLIFDFHSTQRDIFYIQSEKEQTNPPAFTRDWIDGIKRRFPDYEARESGSYNPGSGMLKGWGFDQFGVPSITYEFGDDTPRARIRQIASGAAEEMMQLLLKAR